MEIELAIGLIFLAFLVGVNAGCRLSRSQVDDDQARKARERE